MNGEGFVYVMKYDAPTCSCEFWTVEKVDAPSCYYELWTIGKVDASLSASD